VKAEVDTRDADAARVHELLFDGELEGGSIHV
jgi:hypothetical protein